MLTIGIDLGSTTVKYALLSESGVLLSHDYVRHGSAVKQTLEKVLRALALRTHDAPVHVLFSGSGALGLADALGAGFVQEVIAASRYLKHRAPDLDAAIELGGEDAKLLYLSNGVELRMNEACAGGTGAFIDQMASLLDVDAAGLNKLASEAQISHPMASRCGVFAKTDLVALLNGGVPKSEVARSVLDAVAEQTVSGLACGRPVRGKIAFLGGPLTFLSELRAAFERRLSSTGTTFASFCDAHCAVAIGAALEGMDPASRAHRSRVWHSIDDLVREILAAASENRGSGLPPLFKNPAEREAFTERHRRERVERSPIENAEGDLFLGADLGSTTVKGVVLDTQGRLLYSWYEQNEGQPLERLYRAVKALLSVVPAKAHIRQACTTGYGADLARAALGAAFSEVETLAHERAAAAFEPNVSYVIDIGGQDMKCLEVEHGLIRSVKLNEACSSGCGSFLQTFAKQLSLTLPNARILTPFVDLEFPESVVRAVTSAWPALSPKKVREAVDAAHAALEDYRAAVRQAGEALWRRHETSGEPLIVLAGRPYHLDPLINHGLPALIESMGAEVVTEDAVAHLAAVPSDIEVVNQWTFHSRLYRAAALVRESRSAELVQLMSFGCGIDAVTSEQIERLLAQRGRIATTLKIDEGDTLGAARIRLKSLLAALADRRRSDQKAAAESLEDMTKRTDTPVPLGKMLADRVIYAPQMAPIHFPVICAALGAVGWRVELLPEVRPQAIEEGLKHVNNDACYPAIVVIGQLLDALKTHAIDPDHSALLLAQTCGPCRATNYPTLLRWALKDLHMERVPVVCLSGGSIEGAQTLNVGLGGLKRLMLATLYGDMLQRLSLHVRSHELEPGDAQRLVERWTARAAQAAAAGDARRFADDARAMVRDFFAVPMDGTEKIRVGIVGEILLKYHPAANLGIVQEIIDEGAEPVLGDLAAFFLYCLYDHINQAKAFGGPRLKAMGAWLMIRWFEHLRGIMRKALDGTPVAGVSTLAEDLERIDGLVSAGQEAGEGWLLTAEMVEFIHSGTPNVVCLQPFGCLPNHVTGKGVIRRLREENPLANICAIDFEAGTSKTNVSNRLKLFLAQARENFERGIAVDEPVPTAHRIIPITPSANIAVDAAESPHKDRGGGQAAC